MNIEQLHQLYLDSSGVCTDTRRIFDNCIFFALKGEHFNGNTFAQQALENGAGYAIIDEEEFLSDENILLVDDVLECLQKLATYHRNYLELPIVALTGSNGKTTTKELMYAVLSQKFTTVATQGNLNNHIGVPLTLLSMDSRTEIGIVEMGANHQGEIAFLSEIAQPDVGYITNFGKAHLEGFGGVEGVIKGKSELYTYLKKNDGMIILNKDDEKQVTIVGDYPNFSFSQGDAADVHVALIQGHPMIAVKYKDLIIETHLTGLYNLTNIIAAIAIGDHYDVSPEDIKKGIESYIPSNNRSQIIKQNGNTIVLDAYNANPSSMEAALKNFSQLEGKKVAFLGDMFELGDDAKSEHQYIAALATSLGIETLYLLGAHFFEVDIETAMQFKSFEDFKEHAETPQFENVNILIKGSRGMALERLLDLW